MNNTPQNLTEEEILALITGTCDEFEITPEDLTGPSHLRNLITPRQMLWKFMREEKGMAWKAIGRYLRRDHSTIIKGVERISDIIQVSRPIMDRYLELKDQLNDLVPNPPDSPKPSSHPSPYYGGRTYTK